MGARVPPIGAPSRASAATGCDRSSWDAQAHRVLRAAYPASERNLPLYAVKLVAWSDADAETILVTVPVATPPALSQGDHVVVERLEAMPWVQNGNARVAFRAKSVVPVNGTPFKDSPAK